MTKIARTPMALAVLLMGSLLLTAGCSDDEDPVRVISSPATEPKSTNELMSSFQAFYEARDSEKYLALLDPDFLFLLQSETVDRIPDLGNMLDFAEEERIHQRMFSGEAVIDPQGEFRPAILNIEFRQFRALDVWSETDNETLFPNSVWAPFGVELVFDCGQEHSTFEVNGVTKIYARAYSRMVEGTEITHYLMAGMVDLTFLEKGVERTPWGLIKAFYR
jgi:hypothetical protein